VGRGWGQAAQHSQNLHALFAHIPGLNVVLPSDARDAKGLMLTAFHVTSPVIFIEHRWLHETSAEVPEEPYQIPFGKAEIKREGADLTIAAISQMVIESLKAAEQLEQEGIQAEICDLRTISPLDWETLLGSVRKTGRLIVADTSWRNFGLSAEISARLYETAGDVLKAPVERIALPHGPTPCAASLEKVYYPGAEAIVRSARKLISMKQPTRIRPSSIQKESPVGQKEFVGPF